MEEHPQKKRSKLATFLYILLAFVALSIALQLLNVNVVGKSEEDHLIERPHAD